MEICGNDRTIGFSNCERYFAKGTRGLHGIRTIPALLSTSPNDFLTRLFAEYNAISAQEAEKNAADQAAYEAAMEQDRAIIAEVKDADTANAAMSRFKAISHTLTSQKGLSAMWNENAAAHCLTFDKAAGQYTQAQPESEKGEGE